MTDLSSWLLLKASERVSGRRKIDVIEAESALYIKGRERGFPPRIAAEQFPDLLRLVAEMPDAALDRPQGRVALPVRRRSQSIEHAAFVATSGSFSKRGFRPSEQLGHDVEETSASSEPCALIAFCPTRSSMTQ